MFSNSSECNMAMPFTGNQEDYGISPFCAAMGPPLIYYCQTTQPKCRQNCEYVRKDNRNCFTKAFQWYTEEHVPRDVSAKKSGEVKGFANWLDSKYDQFLQEQCGSCGYKVKHTSITEAYKFPTEPCDGTRRKKFRLKSPWRKKRGHKETGDVTSKCSLHYIMKPKDISRPASETNDMSKSMMMSSEVVLSRYSHSCTSLRVLREPSVAPVKRNQETTQSSHSIKSKKDSMKLVSKTYPEKPQDVVCLCSKVPKINAYTQSDPWPAKSSSKSVPKAETPSPTVPKSETPSPTVPKSETPSPTVPKSETPSQTVPKFEYHYTPEQKAAPCLCSPKLKKIKSKKDSMKLVSKTYPEKPQDVVCLCSKVPKINAYTQSDPWPAKSSSKSVPKAETPSPTVPKSETPSPTVPKSETPSPTVPKSETPSQTVPKSETPSQTVPKFEYHYQPEQKAAPCLCSPKLKKISHPAKIEIEFEAKPSLSDTEFRKCQCSKEFIPKADAQSQFQTEVQTCACGSDHSMEQEKSQIIPKKVRLCPCEYENMDFERCPLQPPQTNSHKNQPNLCNQCIPCKQTTAGSDDGHISNSFNKTTPVPNSLASNPSNKKITGGEALLAAHQVPTTTTNDGVQASNQTTVSNDGVQTSNLSIKLDKDGGAASTYPLFMKIVFADKLCKF